jgi:hypothetical protein
MKSTLITVSTVCLSLFLSSSDCEPVKLLIWSNDSYPDMDLKAIWGIDENNIWAAGEGILKYDGNDWNPVTIPSTAGRLWSIYGFSADDIWAGGEITGGILHYNGQTWEQMQTPNPWPRTDYDQFTVLDIWGTSPNDVWAVGEFDKIMHWNGASWTAFELEDYYTISFFAIWGSSHDNVWMLGDESTLLHWNGSVWSEAPYNITTSWIAGDIMGTSANNIWMASEKKIYNWNGNSWTPSLEGDGVFYALWCTSATDVWTFICSNNDLPIYHWTGTQWEEEDFNPTDPKCINDMFGFAEDNIWAVGNGIISHYGYYRFN